MTSVTVWILATVPLLVWYLYAKLKWMRFEQYKNYPSAPTSLLWGHLKLINEFSQKGDVRRHSGQSGAQILVRSSRP